jgi:hypothetical protein
MNTPNGWSSPWGGGGEMAGNKKKGYKRAENANNNENLWRLIYLLQCLSRYAHIFCTLPFPLSVASVADGGMTFETARPPPGVLTML